MPELERMVRIGHCSGGVSPHLMSDSPSVIARLTNLLAYASEQAPQSLGLPRTFQMLAMTTSFCRCEADEVSRSNLGGDTVLPRFARNDNKSGVLAMTGSFWD